MIARRLLFGTISLADGGEAGEGAIKSLPKIRASPMSAKPWAGALTVALPRPLGQRISQRHLIYIVHPYALDLLATNPCSDGVRYEVISFGHGVFTAPGEIGNVKDMDTLGSPVAVTRGKVRSGYPTNCDHFPVASSMAGVTIAPHRALVHLDPCFSQSAVEISLASHGEPTERWDRENINVVKGSIVGSSTAEHIASFIQQSTS